MSFWWASQGKNHTTAIRQGSLWTAPRIGGSLPTDRALIKLIAPGDVVFHYDGPYLRAVSVATTASAPCHRPDGYPKDVAAQPDAGWLVRVDPVIEGLRVHAQRLAELLPHGSPGPLDRNGTPQQRYLSRLTAQQGALLLEEIDLDNPSPSSESPSSPANEASDAAALVWDRIEQRGLRRRLLDGRVEADCGLWPATTGRAAGSWSHQTPRSLHEPGTLGLPERSDAGVPARVRCLVRARLHRRRRQRDDRRRTAHRRRRARERTRPARRVTLPGIHPRPRSLLQCAQTTTQNLNPRRHTTPVAPPSGTSAHPQPSRNT